MRSVLPGGSPRNMLRSICSVTCRRTRVADEVRAELALAELAERHVVPHDLQLVAVVVGDDVERDVRVGRLDRRRRARCRRAWCGRSPAPARSTDSEFHDVHVVHVLLHVHIAAAGEVGILVADRGGGLRPAAPSGFSVPSTKPEQVAVVEEPEAVHLVDDRDRAGHRLEDPAGQLEADVHATRPGCGTADRRAWPGRVCRGPSSSTNGCSSAGRGPENSRSQASEPIEATTDKPFGRVAEADGAHQPGDVAAARRARLPRRRRRW